MMPAKEIQRIVEEDNDEIVDNIIKEANTAGGLDNITTIIIKL